MKTSLKWLADYLPGPSDRSAFADALTDGGLPVENFSEPAGDVVMDVEVTSNRSDCLSHLGVARELSALLNRPFVDVSPAATESTTTPASAAASVAIEARELCPHYTARVIRGVRVGPSPAWMVARLEAIGLRSVSNVVDVTNYVMFEMGQPLHAFDLDRVDGGQIHVRCARAGEKLISLDGHERDLNPSMLVIADATRPVALAGVMGGRDSEVTGGTVNILLESARFDPLSIRKTARSLAMGSDSSYRFERGLDPQLVHRAGLRAAQLIFEMAGGELLGGVLEAGESGYRPKTLSLRLARLKQVVGVDFPADVVLDALRRDHLQPTLQVDRIDCLIPSYRLDLNLEVDLVEEAIRIIGYDKVPMREEISIRLTRPDGAAEAIEAIRSTLTAGGFFESVTFSFVSDALAKDFIPTDAFKQSPLIRAEHAVRKADAHLRPSILPGLLESIRHNESAGTAEPMLYEIGSTFWNAGDGKPIERKRVALVGEVDVPTVRGVVEALLRRLDPTRAVTVVPDARAGFSLSGCGRIEWGGTAIGFLGTIDRAVSEKLSLRTVPAAAELDLDPLVAGMQHVPQLKPLPKFPAVRRDLSLVTPESTRYEKIESLIRDQKPVHLEELQYVTTYRGKPLEKGQKSVTVTLVFRSLTETLTGEAVDGAVAKVVDAAKQQGWTQRA